MAKPKEAYAPGVKICGITNLSDAQAAIDFKADAIGFVFYPLSPRYIKPQEARKIILGLKKKILKVGVFVDSNIAKVKRIARLCNLDMLQFHGNETPKFCKSFKEYKIIKAFRVKDKNSLKYVESYDVDYYLFDTFKAGLYGGSGDKFNWGLIKKCKIAKPFFLSGGLNVKNVSSAIKATSCSWVDASSGIEKSAGIKNIRLLKKFIEKVKNK